MKSITDGQTNKWDIKIECINFAWNFFVGLELEKNISSIEQFVLRKFNFSTDNNIIYSKEYVVKN